MWLGWLALTIIPHFSWCSSPYLFFKNLESGVITRFPDISDKEIKEAEDYLHSFYEYSVKYANIIADKYKTPFLPKGEDAQKEISEYVSECRKQYPEIDAEKIESIFSTVCWLANR